jgi:glycosyltransferase involved in cell wall biosynthesis
MKQLRRDEAIRCGTEMGAVAPTTYNAKNIPQADRLLNFPPAGSSRGIFMKIIICCNAYPPNFIGGAELIAHYQAKALQDLGHTVLIFTGDPRMEADRHAVIEDHYDELKVFRVRLTHEDYSSDFVNFLHRDIDDHFQKILSEFSPDVVHFHNIIGLSLGMIHRAKRMGAITALTVHDHWGFCHKNTILKMADETCFNFSRCSECMPYIKNGDSQNIPNRFRRDYFSLMMDEVDLFISPSRYLAEQYLKAGVGVKKFKVIWYGIDVDRFARVNKIPNRDKIRFTFIGYFGKHKGVQTLLNALSLLAYKHHVTVNLVGEGDQLPEYKKIISEHGLDPLVKFWGKVDHKRTEDVYQETDVLVLPSIWPENQPVTITEAMAAGIPVIASRMGGIPELIDAGVNGFLFRAGDESDLARKMSYFISNVDKLIPFGEKAQSKILGNTYRKRASEILEEYRRLSGSPARTTRTSIIACIGERVDPTSLMAINEINLDSNGCRFVRLDWIEAEHFNDTVLFWVVDQRVDPRSIAHLFKYGIPFLVPERNQQLTELCRKTSCGLYFWDSMEAKACIEYMLGNRLETSIMGNSCKSAVKAIHSH